MGYFAVTPTNMTPTNMWRETYRCQKIGNLYLLESEPVLSLRVKPHAPWLDGVYLTNGSVSLR